MRDVLTCDVRRAITVLTMVVVEGTVLAQLPRGLYKVGIDNQRQVTAHAPSGPGKNFIRVLVGDRVRIELSPRDLTRGRIVGKIS